MTCLPHTGPSLAEAWEDVHRALPEDAVAREFAKEMHRLTLFALSGAQNRVILVVQVSVQYQSQGDYALLSYDSFIMASF